MGYCGNGGFIYVNNSLDVTSGIYCHSPDNGLASSVIDCSGSCAASQTLCIGFTVENELKQCYLLTCTPEGGEKVQSLEAAKKAYFREPNRLLARGECILQMSCAEIVDRKIGSLTVSEISNKVRRRY